MILKSQQRPNAHQKAIEDSRDATLVNDQDTIEVIHEVLGPSMVNAN